MDTRETVSAVYYLGPCASACVTELILACADSLYKAFGDQVAKYSQLCACGDQHPAKHARIRMSHDRQTVLSMLEGDCATWHVHVEAGSMTSARAGLARWSLHGVMNARRNESTPIHMIVCNVNLASISSLAKSAGVTGLLELLCAWAADSRHVISGLIDVSYNDDTKAGMYYVIEPSLGNTTWDRKRAAAEWLAHTSAEVASMCRGVYWGTYLRDDLLERLSPAVLHNVLDQSTGLAPPEEAPRVVRLRCGTAVLLSHSPESMLSAYQEDDNTRAELRMSTLLTVELRRRGIML